MPRIESEIDPNSADYQVNAAAMQALVDEFRELESRGIKAAEAKRARYAKRNELLPRDRLSLLLDSGSPFVELCSLAGLHCHDDKDGTQAGGGLIAGIGFIAGVRCLIQVNNFAVKGGTISPAGLDKTLRLQTIARENKLPLVTLAQSGGANLNYAAEVFVQGARCFAAQARLSAMGLPQVTVVHGSATAGGAYQPGLSDYVVMVKKKATLYLAGPPLLYAATGEIATDEALGGAEMHTQTAGTGEYLACDDRDGILIARDILRQLPWQLQPRPLADYAEPLYPAEELLGVVPTDAKKPYDVREILARIADGSEFLDFKDEFDSQTVCGHIKIEGYALGIIGNNGPITSAGAAKAAQFIQLCEQANIPLLFLHNTTGFQVGSESEQSGIIKHGSKMLQAVANASVAKFSLVVGGSYGAGNYAMCGRGLDPRFIFAWPNSRTAVMGGEQAGKVMRIVATQKSKAMGAELPEEQLEAMEADVRDRLNASATALFGTARLWDDGLIDPRDTRKLLGFLLATCDEAQRRELKANQFGVPRF